MKYLPHGHHICFPTTVHITSPKQGPSKLRRGKWEDFDKNERWLLFRIGDGAIYDCFLPGEAMESEQAAQFDLNTLRCRWKGCDYGINKSWV